MSNSSRIEAATRQHVGAVLTSEQIVELVKMSNPDWKGGVYPSDAAYKRADDGLVPRGKTAYGDGVLEYLAPNSFKVLPTQQIIRRPSSAKTPTVTVTASAPVASSAPVPAEAKPAGKRKAVKASSQPSSPAKSKAVSKGSVQ